MDARSNISSASVAASLPGRSLAKEVLVAHTDPVAQPGLAGRSSRPARRRLVIQALLAVAVVAVVYLVLLPKLADVNDWRSPGVTAALQAHERIRCPECGTSMLLRIGDVAIPLEQEAVTSSS